MDTIKTTEIAHALYRAQGDQAEAEAARRERQFAEAKNEEEAARWREIRSSIRAIRGANQS
jgi:hypothetical protein